MIGSRPGMTAAQVWVLALMSVASLMVALDALVVSPALNTIRGPGQSPEPGAVQLVTGAWHRLRDAKDMQ